MPSVPSCRASILLAAGLLVCGVQAVVAGPPQSREDRADEAVTAFVQRAELPEDVRTALLTTVRQHPHAGRWAGPEGTQLYALAVEPLPTGNIRGRATPVLLNATQALAIQELLLTQALQEAYGAAGLTDATMLRRAVLRAAGELDIVGEGRGILSQARPQDDFAVAYVVGDTTQLKSRILQPAQLDRVRAAYREAMHQQIRELMKHESWSDAVVLWKHLRERQLVSAGLYLDAARCYEKLREPGAALAVLEEGFMAVADTASADWLEACGDLALNVGARGEPLAQRAYEKASERLSNVRGGDVKRP